MAEQFPKVSIIILNYNTYHLTIDEIDNIEDTLEYDNLNIIIVDNRSTNDSVVRLNNKILNNKGKFQYTLIQSQNNGGYAAGNNVGLKEAIRRGSKYSLIVNNDILFTSYDTVKRIVDYLESNPDISAISPRIESNTGYHDKPIFYKKPSFWDLSFGIKNYRKGRYQQDDELIYEIYAPRGSCMMVRNEDIQAMGLLDEGTFLYYEEPILAESLLKRGRKVVHYGELYVIHNHAETINHNVSKKRRRDIVVQSLDLYLKKYRHFNKFERWVCKMIRKYAYLYSHK